LWTPERPRQTSHYAHSSKTTTIPDTTETPHTAKPSPVSLLRIRSIRSHRKRKNQANLPVLGISGASSTTFDTLNRSIDIKNRLESIDFVALPICHYCDEVVDCIIQHQLSSTRVYFNRLDTPEVRNESHRVIPTYLIQPTRSIVLQPTTMRRRDCPHQSPRQ
jgi:hypothetical protein